MGLSTQQLDYLKTASQRFACHVALFPAFAPTLTPPEPGDSGTLMAFKPIPRCTPRLAVVDNSESVDLYGRDAYAKPGFTYPGDANIAWVNTGGAGTLTDNEDGTANWEAPAEGSGTNLITMTATNATGAKDALIYVQYPKSTYDDVVSEVMSITASVDSHGWKMLVRARGDVADFTIGKAVLLHVEDTWAGTASTFGGYKYAEGQLVGYISEAEYFEDWAGETWLGIEVASPWDWILANIKVGETYWGRVAGGGRFYHPDFAPVDAVYWYVNELTDFTTRHDAVLWDDGNTIDDFVIDESDLATIITDVMARTLAIAFVDRYGALYCIPDPDVRADEFWGSPSPTFEFGNDGPLDESFCPAYAIKNYPSQRVKKLQLEGFTNAKLGIWAISQMATGIGGIKEIRGLICDQASTLASWAAQKRAQMNRPWEIRADLWLNHVVDLANFVDVNFTAPSQTNAPTASGQTWVHSLTYRPNVFEGGWRGSWRLLKRTEGDEDGVSGWGGTGMFFPTTASAPTSNPGYGSGTGGWDVGSSELESALVATWQSTMAQREAEVWSTGYQQLISGALYHLIISGVATADSGAGSPGIDAQYRWPQGGGAPARVNYGQMTGSMLYSVTGAATATATAQHMYGYPITATANGGIVATRIGVDPDDAEVADGAQGGWTIKLWRVYL